MQPPLQPLRAPSPSPSLNSQSIFPLECRPVVRPSSRGGDHPCNPFETPLGSQAGFLRSSCQVEFLPCNLALLRIAGSDSERCGALRFAALRTSICGQLW